MNRHGYVFAVLVILIVAVSLSPTFHNYAYADSSIPQWIKTIFIWYGQGKVSDGELITALKYLINQHIIQIDLNSPQSNNANTTTNPNPTSSNQPSATTLSSQQSSSTQPSNGIITNDNFLQVQNNADNFVNQWAKLEGTFTQDPFVQDGANWVVFNYAQGDTLDVNKEVWFTYTDPSVNIKSNDCAIAEGHIQGSATLQFKLTGATEQIPQISLEKLTKISCLEAKYPANFTFNLGLTQTQGNIKVTLDRMETSQYHTRIFAKVENLGDPKGIDFEGGTIVQGQNQFNTIYGPFGISENNLNVVTGIQNGVVENGVLFFNPLGNQPFKLMLKGIEESSFTEDDFIFNIYP